MHINRRALLSAAAATAFASSTPAFAQTAALPAPDASDDDEPLAIAAGRLHPAERLRRTLGEGLAPTVVVRPEASSQSTVLEVRAADRTGVLYLACAALAAQGLSVRSAHVDTLGPQAVDVFYVQEEGAGALGDLRASQAAHAVREALTPAS